MKGKTHAESAKTRDAMRAYKAEGHTNKEVAERFGYTVDYTSLICKGIARQQSKEHSKPINPRNQYTSWTFDRIANAKRYVEERTPGFEYVGNYTGIDGYVDLKCKACGAIIRRSMVCVKHGSVRCDECYRREIEQRAAQKIAEKESERKQREWDRTHKRYAHMNVKQVRFGVCEMCGALYVTCGQKRKFCSVECGVRCNDAIKKDRRIRKMREVVDNKSITLERLYKKAKGVCALCGGLCDYKDYIIRDDGVFIAGGNYPSIDHIVPLNKGGRHAWNNVQLACRDCNSKKSDSIAPTV